jgi:hypothetical protein
LAVPIEDLPSIAAILASGYLRYRRRAGREDPLDSPTASSVHGHEVNASEKGEDFGDPDSRTD